MPDDGRKYYLNGGWIAGRRLETPLAAELYRVYDSAGDFLGIGQRLCKEEENGLKARWGAEGYGNRDEKENEIKAP